MSNTNSPYLIIASADPNNPQSFTFHIDLNGQELTSEHYVFKWTFGDGTDSVEAKPNKSFSSGGEFTINCDVKPIIEPKPDGDEAGSSSPPPPPPIIINT